MKKLIVAIAAVAVGYIANAAAVTWSSGEFDLAAAGGSGWGTATSKTGSAYSDVYTASVYFFSTYDEGTLSGAINPGGTVSTSDTNKKGLMKGTTGDSFTAGTYYTYMEIIETATGNKLTSDIVSFTYDGGLAEPSLIFFGANASGFNEAAGAHGYASASGWAAAPEPTSGLLLLLGVAGLALKRKRA